MPFIIAIAGGSGSGKTTLAKNLAKHYEKEGCLIVSADMFYRCRSGLTRAQIEAIDFDHPEAIEYSLLKEVLENLRQNKSTVMPSYDFTTSTRQPGSEIKPAPIIIVEGITVLHAKELKKLFDVEIFVDAESWLCLSRRIERDTGERGREIKKILKQYVKVRRAHDEFVEPTKEEAHLVVTNQSVVEDKSDDINFDIKPVIDYLERVRKEPTITLASRAKLNLFPQVSASESADVSPHAKFLRSSL